MLTAFYAPLKPKTEGQSGDRRSTSRLMREVLARAGHAVDLVSTFSSYDDLGDPDQQATLRNRGVAHAHELVSEWRNGKRGALPQLWVTHHAYYKSPDWLGPVVSAELGIPYVIVEASHAPKQTGGRWAIGHDGAANAIRRADLVLCQTNHDAVFLEPLVLNPNRVARLSPFLDPQPFRAAAGLRAEYRESIAETLELDPGVAWIVVAEAMEPGDKTESYRALAILLAGLSDLPWRLLIAGDGPARSAIEAQVNDRLPGRTRCLGNVSPAELAALFSVADLYVWPSVNESYGRSLYEAQAAGSVVVCAAPRGVPQSILEGRTGVHVPPGNSAAMAQSVRELLLDPPRREHIGREAMQFIEESHSIEAVANQLDRVLATLLRWYRR
jgi:glycosyltransferase involved in cell wall biosynthesis